MMLLLTIAVVVAESHPIFRVTADYNDVIMALFICFSLKCYCICLQI